MTIPVEVSRYRRAEAAFRPMGLNNRAINALVRGGIYSVEDLGGLTETRARAIPGLGLKTINQIRPYLKSESPVQALPWEEREVTTRFDAKTLAEIDSWLDTQAGLSSRPTAIRYLVAKGLKATLKPD